MMVWYLNEERCQEEDGHLKYQAKYEGKNDCRFKGKLYNM